MIQSLLEFLAGFGPLSDESFYVEKKTYTPNSFRSIFNGE